MCKILLPFSTAFSYKSVHHVPRNSRYWSLRVQIHNQSNILFSVCSFLLGHLTLEIGAWIKRLYEVETVNKSPDLLFSFSIFATRAPQFALCCNLCLAGNVSCLGYTGTRLPSRDFQKRIWDTTKTLNALAFPSCVH